MSAIVVVGKRAGPTMMITAAIHGDEINGVEIIRRVLRTHQMRDLRGTLIAIPVVNVHGFLAQTRYLPDGRDLNRIFPGSASGSLGARVANRFVEVVLSRVDYGLDLHTGARHRTNLPQLRVDLNYSRAKEIAESFGVPVLLHASPMEGSLREAAFHKQIPVLTYEAGEALRFDEFSIRVGVRGVLNMLRHLGMLRAVKRPRRAPEPLMTFRSTWVRAATSGVFRSLTALGKKVSKGEPIGIIADPMGTIETAVYATDDGIVIGKSNLPLVSEGDAIFHLARYRERSDEALAAIRELRESFSGGVDEGLLSS